MPAHDACSRCRHTVKTLRRRCPRPRALYRRRRHGPSVAPPPHGCRCRPTGALRAAHLAGARCPGRQSRTAIAAPPTAPHAGSRPGSGRCGGRPAVDAVSMCRAQLPEHRRRPPTVAITRIPVQAPTSPHPLRQYCRPRPRRRRPGAPGLAEVLADVMHIEQVPVDGHFFDDLGADSLVMAQFCARVRKREDLPSVSMKDVYRHPTIRSLAAALVPAAAPVDPRAPCPIAESPRRCRGARRA